MTYLIPDQLNKDAPPAIAERMIAKYKEFEHLKEGEAIVTFLMDTEEEHQHGKRILGRCHLPQVQGKLRGVFKWAVESLLGYSPDFIITLDLDYWTDASDKMREILVFHELSHCAHKLDRDGEPMFDEDGRPIFGIAPHDVEEFISTVARYGAYSEDIRLFMLAAGERVCA